MQQTMSSGSLGVSYCRFGVILSSTRSKREMRMRTTIRLSRSDAIRNNSSLGRIKSNDGRSRRRGSQISTAVVIGGYSGRSGIVLSVDSFFSLIINVVRCSFLLSG